MTDQPDPPFSERPTEPQPSAPATEPRPAEPQPAAAHAAGPVPRRLTRSSTDRVVAGVAGGLGRHLGIDPLALRIGFVILAFAGGFGIFAYLICLVFIPTDDPAAPPLRWGVARGAGAVLLGLAALGFLIPDWAWGPGIPLALAAGVVAYLLIRVVRDDGASHLGRTAAKVGIAIVLACLAAGGVVAAAAGAALGGGIVVAGLVVACGVGLIGGAFRGGARWLIVPAVVLAVPLAAVAATDLDARGAWGERIYRPGTVAAVAGGYDMGAGSLRVDLRDVRLPAGRTTLPLDLGIGEIQVLVARGTCVTTDAQVGIGAVDTGDGEQGGVDVALDDGRTVAAGVPELHVDAAVDVGIVQVGDSVSSGGPRWGERESWDGDRWARLQTGTSRTACREAA